MSKLFIILNHIVVCTSLKITQQSAGHKTMAKEQFYKNFRIGKARLDRLSLINKIIEEYQEQGYRLTLRQLYYQLVSRDIIPNSLAEYQKLSGLLKDGRMLGIVDWDVIEDRIRVPRIPYCVNGIYDALRKEANIYRLDRMENQNVYVEVWAEKDALSGILSKVTREYHVNLVINRGYSSCSAMYDAAYRLLEQIENGKKCTILYLGDLDPSGEDMVRDIRDRLEEFGLPEITVKKIGLTYEQVQFYKPPPNYTKVKDPRAKDYIKKYGRSSWEVDALRPNVLEELLISEIDSCIDIEKLEERKKEEEEQKKILMDLAEDYKKGME